ncbi:MAG: hypothetical protein CMM10_07930 [Rhodospirillaceae bacterium]|nr:hypothetical protein [Rhodospirillaceae bacterium]
MFHIIHLLFDIVNRNYFALRPAHAGRCVSHVRATLLAAVIYRLLRWLAGFGTGLPGQNRYKPV